MDSVKISRQGLKNKYFQMSRNVSFLVAILGPLFFFSIPVSVHAGSIINRPLYTGLDNGLIGRWTFDGQDVAGSAPFVAFDKSGNGNNASSTGSAVPTKVVGKIGQGLQFDGTANYLGTTNMNPNSAAISISFWMNMTQTPSNKIGLEVSGNYNSFTDGLAFTLGDTAGACTGALTASLYGGVTYTGWCITPPSLNTWHHYVIVADRSKTTNEVQIYLDGALAPDLGSSQNDQSGTFGSEPLFFGARYNAGTPGNFATDKLDDVRYYNRALSTDEIKRLYKMGGTFKIGMSRKDSLTEGLVGYWTLDGLDVAGVTAYDSSGQGINGTLTNGPVRTLGKIGQGIRFDRTTNQDISLSDDAYDSLTQGTISTWVKSDSYPGSNGGIFSATVGGCGIYFSTYMINGSTFRFEEDANGDATYDVMGTVSISNPQGWHHLVYTVDAAGNKVYVDGQQVTPSYTSGSASTNVFFANLTAGTTAYKIGRCGGSEVFGGTIDDVRLYNRALSTDEIKRLYKMGGTFKINIPRKDSLTDGLLGYWTFDGPDVAGSAPFTAIDKTGNGNIASTTGAAVPTKTVGKIGQGLQFDGVDDYIGTININPNSIAVSFSFWMNMTQTPSGDHAFETSTNFNNPTDGVNLTMGDSGCLGGSGSTAAESNAGATYTGYCFATPSLNTWHHYVVIVDRSLVSPTREISVYVDGVAPAENGASNTDYSTNFGSEPLFFGARYNSNGVPSGFLAGKLDEFRYYNRALTTDEIKRLYAMGR